VLLSDDVETEGIRVLSESLKINKTLKKLKLSGLFTSIFVNNDFLQQQERLEMKEENSLLKLSK